MIGMERYVKRSSLSYSMDSNEVTEVLHYAKRAKTNNRFTNYFPPDCWVIVLKHTKLTKKIYLSLLLVSKDVNCLVLRYGNIINIQKHLMQEVLKQGTCNSFVN